MLRRLIAEPSSREYFANLRLDRDEADNRVYMDFIADRFTSLARNEALRNDFLNQYRRHVRVDLDD